MKYMNPLKIILLTLLILLSAGCTKETVIENGGKISPDEDVTVVMTLNIPGATATRGLTATQEEAVNNIDVFVFDKNLKLTDWQYGELENNAGVVSFSAILKASKNSSDKFRIMVLANVRQTTFGIFQGTDFGGHKGKTYAQVRALLQANVPSYNDLSSKGIPMWGEIEDMVLLNANAVNNHNIDLLRSLVRIDVGTHSNPTFAATGLINGWAALENFSLEEVYLYNPGSTYALAPDRTNYSYTDKQVSAVSLPAPNTKNTTPILYSTMTQAGTSLTGTIYTGESDVEMNGIYGDGNHTSRTALVIMGYYSPDPMTPNTTVKSYYRLDFLEGINGSSLMDLLRNNDYQVVIRSVSGPGSPTKEIALESFNTDLVVMVNRWSDAGQAGTTVNGDWWLKVSPYSFRFDKWAKTEQEITVTTNVAATAGKSWTATVEKFVNADADPTWLTIISGTESGTTGNVLKFNVAQVPGAFTAADSRRARIRFKAGTMQHDIIVEQTGEDGDHMLRLSHSELIFTGRKWDATANSGAGAWVDPDPQELAVNWGPTVWNYRLNLSNYVGSGVTMITPFPSDSDEQRLSIAPAALSESDPRVVADPFFECSSRLAITVYDEGYNSSTAITKQVLIRQVYYSLLITGAKDYYYQGNSYALTVRSNTKWTAAVNDSGSILENITGTSGNGSTSAAGENFRFQIKSNASIGGSATVTFTSPDDLFPPETITIIAQDVLPNSYIVYPGQSKTIPVTKAYRVWKLDRDLKDIFVDGDLPSGTATAELLWQDEQGLITNVALGGSGRHAQIAVATASGKSGNAVVAYKIDDVVYWSWHIWVTDYDPETTHSVNGPYILMDRNLGALASNPGSGTDAEIKKTFGLYYQVGRKDPVPIPSAYTNTSIITSMIPIYDITDNAVSFATQNTPPGAGEPGGTNLGNAIHNPMTYYLGNYGEASWYGATIPFREDLYTDYEKSDYDPCPHGWRLGTRLAFTKNGGGSSFTPASAMVDRNFYIDPLGYLPVQGSISHTGFYNYIHPNDSYAIIMYTLPENYSFSVGYIITNSARYNVNTVYTRAAHGYNIRCIKE